MHLDAVRIAGFKSFTEATQIKFPSNFCAIVGPNGCGKSNIVDAVRWALGEVSARQLRGSQMSDVVFNGAQDRGPAGLASVTLVLNNSSGGLGAHGRYAGFPQIVTRRSLARDGQSDYFINDTRCRHRDLLDLFASTGLGPRSYAIVGQGAVSRLIDAKPEGMRVLIEEAAGIARYRELRRKSENRIQQTRENLSRLNDLRSELERQLQSLRRQVKAAERYRRLRAQSRRQRAEQGALEWRARQLALERARASFASLASSVEATAASQRAEESALNELRLKRERIASRADAAQRDLQAGARSLARAERDIAERRRQHDRLEHSRRQLESQQKTARDDLAAEGERVAAWREQLAQIEERHARSRRGLAEARQKLNAARAQMAEWQAAWDAGQVAQDSSQAEWSVQASALQHLRGRAVELASAAKRGDEASEEWAERNGFAQVGRLGEELAIAEGWEVAVDAALGGLLRGLLLDSLQSLDGRIEGTVELTALERGVDAPGLEPRAGLEPLLRHIRSGESLVRDALAGVHVCEDLSDGLAKRARLLPGERLVTRDGMLLGRNWLWIFPAGKREGLLQRLRQLSDLEKEIAARERDLEALAKRAESERAEALAEREVRRKAAEHAQSAEEREREAVHELALQSGELSARIKAGEENQRRLQGRIEAIEKRRQEQSQQERQEQQPLEGLERSLQDRLAEQSLFERQCDDLRGQLDLVQKSVSESEQRARELGEQLAREREQLHANKLEERGAEVEIDGLRKQVREYDFEPQALLEELLGDDLEAHRADGDALAARLAEHAARLEGESRATEEALQRLGGVNLAAADDCKVLEQRKQHMDAQNEELEKSLETLRAAIAHIDGETRTRFKQTLEAVNGHLGELFRELFGGGFAALETGEGSLLEAGVTLMARPPGKRNVRLAELSGGEKALTAIALVFSLFRLNPAPFCLLDEVDAPLDDFNVARFAKLVRKLSQTVQMICVTHNQATMAAADCLVGVTMRTPGISSLYGVSFDEVMSELERQG